MLRNQVRRKSPPKTPPQKFNRVGTAVDAVYEILRDWIISGALAPAERLRADALAKKIKVSRTPVREALRKLEAEGFVTLSAAHGLAVAELREQDLTEIFQVREALEGVAARLAAENATRAELARLRELVEEMQGVCGKGDVEGMRSLVFEYHQTIHRAARNERLRQILKALQDRTRQFQASVFQIRGYPAQVCEDYQKLLGALEARDGPLAERLAREHRGESFALRIRLLRERMRADRTSRAAPAKSK